MGIRADFIVFATVIQSILFLTHLFIYRTWTFAPAGSELLTAAWLKASVGVLSVSFLSATLLAFRFTNPVVRAFYRVAAVWLGIVSFLFFAAVWVSATSFVEGAIRLLWA